MLTMITEDFTTMLILFAFTLVMMMLAMFSWGYSRGSRAIVPARQAALIDERPPAFQAAEEAPITGPIQISVLEPTTGPIDLIIPGLVLVEPEPLTQEAVDELQEARVTIADLEQELIAREEELHKKDILRARYLRLLRTERMMTKQLLIGQPVCFTRYWKKYLDSTLDRFDITYPILGDWKPNIKLPTMPQNRLYAVNG